MDYLARLQPFDPKREHAMRVFVLGRQKFEAGVWIKVDEAVAETLRTVHQNYYDALSPLAFEVRSAAEVADTADEPSTNNVDEAAVESPPDEPEVHRRRGKKSHGGV